MPTVIFNGEATSTRRHSMADPNLKLFPNFLFFRSIFKRCPIGNRVEFLMARKNQIHFQRHTLLNDIIGRRFHGEIYQIRVDPRTSWPVLGGQLTRIRLENLSQQGR